MFKSIIKKEALKLKIFNVLVGKISVLEFENWLYTSEEIIENLDNSTFYFDLISINYKSERWNEYLEKLLFDNFDKDNFMVFFIASTCNNLYKSKSTEESIKLLDELNEHFDYETRSLIQWVLFELYSDFDLIKDGIFDGNELNVIVKCTSQKVLELLSEHDNFEEKKKCLMNEIEAVEVINTNLEKEKRTLKQKLLAYFKKI